MKCIRQCIKSVRQFKPNDLNERKRARKRYSGSVNERKPHREMPWLWIYFPSILYINALSVLRVILIYVKSFCHCSFHCATIHTKGINQFMQKMSFLWNVYCRYFNSCLHVCVRAKFWLTHPLHANTKFFVVYSNQKRVEWFSVPFFCIFKYVWVHLALSRSSCCSHYSLLEVKWICARRSYSLNVF